jgi:hypothetical protein
VPIGLDQDAASAGTEVVHQGDQGGEAGGWEGTLVQWGEAYGGVGKNLEGKMDLERVTGWWLW